MRAAGERLDELDVLPTQAFRIDAETIALLIDRGNSEAVTRVDLKRIAAEVMQRLTHPVDVDGQRFLLATSAGGALYPDDARDPDEYVNVCMEALQLGRAHVSTPVTNAHLVCRLLLEKNTYKHLTLCQSTT